MWSFRSFCPLCSSPQDILIDFRERGRNRERRRCGGDTERQRESNIYVREIFIRCPPYTPDRGRNPQPRYVPWPGMEPTTFRCSGWHSNQLSYPARAFGSLFWVGWSRNSSEPCLVWLSGLGAVLQTKRLLGSVRSQGTRLGCGPGPSLVGGWWELPNGCFSPLLSPSLPLF